MESVAVIPLQSWKIRWFVLRNEELSYYNKEKVHDHTHSHMIS